MGNRFLSLPGYQSLVRAHGVLAAITFLGLIPASIFLARFYGRNPPWARRLHIWLNVLALLLATVLFILGFMAVGPERSLSNPHHGIGVAIYTLLWFELINGCLWRNKGQKRTHLPLSLMLHAWFGRALALLGIAQVALGLTLYGSPAYLFVLYTLWTFAMLVLYFILEWLAGRRRARYGSEGSSYYTDEVVSARPEKKSGVGKWLAAGAGALGLAALLRRRDSHNKPGPGVVGTESSATSYMTNEKYSDVSSHKGWGHRLMQIGAIGGAVFAVKKLFGRKDRDDVSEAGGPYRPHLGGNQSVTTSDTVSRIEEGRPPIRPTTPIGASPGYVSGSHPLAQPPMTPGPVGRVSNDSYSYYSYGSGSPSRQERKGNTFRNALAAGGAAFAVRQLFKNRKQKKEDRRQEELRQQRIEEERIARMNSAHKYTGDGITPPRRARPGRFGSQSASDASSLLEDAPGAVIPGTAGAAAASALADRNRIRPVGADPVISPPGPPMAGPVGMPPVPPVHQTNYGSSGSEIYTTASGNQHHRHHLGENAAAALGGAALGAVAADGTRRRTSNQNTNSLESPPVSVKVKMHNDGRHVTLRRLTEEEAAAQRRRDRKASSNRRRRNSSFSSSSGGEALAGPSGDSRWRRTEALEAQQEAANQAAATGAPPPPIQMPYPTPPPPGTQGIDPRATQSYNLPPPPPIPGSSSNIGPSGSAITSPGTETSGATEYANNRRRRRAERAQARLAREGRAQNTVDFT
jgi:signal transduction histidine kinase